MALVQRRMGEEVDIKERHKANWVTAGGELTTLSRIGYLVSRAFVIMS